MTEEAPDSPVRRSFRLKDKPTPEYSYKNYLRKDYLPPAVIETNKKYEDLFSSVVTNALSMDIQKIPDEFRTSKEVSQKRRISSSEEEECGDSDVSEDMDSDDAIESYHEIQMRIEEDNLLRRERNLPKKKKKRYIYKKKKEISFKEAKPDKQTEKMMSKLKNIVEKIEKGVERMKKNSEVIRRLSENSSDCEIVGVLVKESTCSCGKQLNDHMDCHRHIYEEHFDNDINADCNKCGWRLEEIRKHHACPICYRFALDLEEHLASHYRNCTSKYAVMECRFCTKQFKTVKEAMAHEQEKHLTKPLRKLPLCYKCNECPSAFATQENLTYHYNSHIDLNELSDKIDELQYKVDASKEECPFCRINLVSRKTFRAHMLKKHWNACKSLSKMTLSEVQTDREIKQEIDELTRLAEIQETAETTTLKEVKKEVKEEILDDGYDVITLD
ncbi:hypothetical protein CRE_26699 [Caenorhabditis remanei]|uniref:C2H2-type domain-containing protein n=1 Tax=Caenorhabditis remanei TaxID=31234 RepID=E3ML19_CAERE|nr:hypothetical protein CRE_26699 [Caenorhabditis remanei]